MTAMRHGFTVLELLVASLLLSMLVAILTMVFNQSSIAWTTCLASEAELSGVRVKLSAIHDISDDLLPGLGQDDVTASGSTDNREIIYRNVSLFKGWDGKNASSLVSDAPREDGNCRGRAYDKFSTFQIGGFFAQGNQVGSPRSFFAAKDVDTGVGGARGANGRGVSGVAAYIVGVRSRGPDGVFGTEDDITSYPEDAK